MGERMEEDRRSEKRKRWKRGRRRPRVAGARSRWAGWDNQSREMSRVPRSPRQLPRSDRWQAWWMAAHSEHPPLGAREKGGEGRTVKSESRGPQVVREVAIHQEIQGRLRIKQEVNKVVMTTGSKCFLQVHGWHVWDEVIQICLEAELFSRYNIGWVKPPQPGHRPLSRRPYLRFL